MAKKETLLKVRCDPSLLLIIDEFLTESKWHGRDRSKFVRQLISGVIKDKARSMELTAKAIAEYDKCKI